MVSIHDIAKLAGVTEMTVSRILAGKTLGKRSDAKERAEKILRIAKELGYQPSNIAKSLRDGRSRTIGMVIGGLSYHHFGCVAETVIDEANRHDYKTLLQAPKWGRDSEREALEELLRYRVDGVFYVCALPAEAAETHKRLATGKFPLMALERNALDFPSFDNNYAKAIRDAVTHLRSRGHTRIAFSSLPGNALRCERMESAFRESCAENGVEASVFPASQPGNTDAILAARPPAALVDGELMMNSFIKGAAKIEGYKPDAIGFYTEWSWVRRNPAIVGAIMVEAEPRVRAAVRALVEWIEKGTPPPGRIFEARFHPVSTFDAIRYKPLDVEPLSPADNVKTGDGL